MKKLKTCIVVLICILTFVKISVAQNKPSIHHSLLLKLTLPSDGRSMRSSSTDVNFDGNDDSKLIQPGETLVLADLEGPGIIKHIWNTSGSLNPYSVRAMVNRIYWDNSDKPSVEVPLGDFFGVKIILAMHGDSVSLRVPSMESLCTKDQWLATGFRHIAGTLWIPSGSISR